MNRKQTVYDSLRVKIRNQKQLWFLWQPTHTGVSHLFNTRLDYGVRSVRGG